MTEAEWLACAEPEKILKFLQGKVSDRKLRLFACACCRHIWRFLKDKRSWKAIEVSERYADGEATDKELMEAEGDAWDAAGGEGAGSNNEVAAWAASDVDAAISCVPEMAVLVSGSEKKMVKEILAQCDLLRDIFRSPFRPMKINSTWLTPAVRKMAQAIYNERAFDRLPILADALEEARCTNQDILDHCRSGGEHVRGCWVIDALLGKS